MDLPVEARIRLVEDLWDSIAADQSNLPLTDAQKNELDIRLDEFEMDGVVGEAAGKIIAEIRRRL